MTHVSLLLCTRDRGISLDRTLASITRAADGFDGLQVIVVDNGSIDDTTTRLAAWRVQQRFAVTIVEESRPGLARARNAGLARATGRIVAMTDDDCVLDRSFFALLVQRFADVPAPMVIGGRILLGDEADLPVTIKLEDHAMLASPDAFPGGFVMGANLAFTRDVVDRVGPFDERFGAGARFVAAEDTDFLFRAMGCGVPVRYDPHFAVAHHHGRRSPAALRTLLAGYAFGDGALYAKHILYDARIVRTLFRDIGNVVGDLRAGPRPFESIRFFHAFRLCNIVRGLAVYIWAAMRERMSVAPARRVHRRRPIAGRSA